MTRVLVTGATGQDAGWLMPLLVEQGYEVYGMVRNTDVSQCPHLKDIPFLTLVLGDLLDFPSLLSVFGKVHPDVVINTAGITSPSSCWGTPELAAATNGVGAVRLMDLLMDNRSKFIQFGSIAEFGPYGASKMYAQMMVDDYRNRGLHATTIRFAGHHSPRRAPLFFSRRVSQSVARIRLGKQQGLSLGPLDRVQDWGYAPEFMQAVLEVLDKEPGTYTVATGEPHSLAEYVQACFEVVDLDWRDHVTADDYMVQPVDVTSLTAPPDARLSWRAVTELRELATHMVTADMVLEMESQ